MRKKRIINYLFLILGILCLLYYVAMGLAVRFGQSLLWLWPCISAVCFLRFFVVRSSVLQGKPLPFSRSLIIMVHIILVFCFAIFLFVECFVIKDSFAHPQDHLDCIIVLGAKVNGEVPSGALNERIHTAADYLKNNPTTLCIASGGQGDDEGISESECIRRYLTALGIEEDRIIMEDQSVNTASNLRNSFALIPDSVSTVGILTNDFHVFRAVSMAKATDAPYLFYGISARSSLFGYVHYAMREFFSIALGMVRGDLSPTCFFS